MPIANAQTEPFSPDRQTNIDSSYVLKIQHALQNASFVDVACRMDGEQLLIMYSRSIYRQGSYATLKLLGALDTLMNDRIKELIVIVNDRNIPLYSHSFQVHDGKISISDSNYSIGKGLPEKEPLLPISGKYSNYTFLFSLDPQVRFAFGASEDPIQVQLNLLPSVYLQLWRGSQVRFQYILPLWNELDIPEEDNPRPGLITFSQYVPLGKVAFGNVTVGYFDPYRYGAQVQVGKFLLRDRLFLGAQLGYSGYASYPKRLNVNTPEPGWEISDINYFDYQLTAGWRWNEYHLQLFATYGRGLYQQEFKMFAVNRQFKQTNIEFFVQQLDENWNYGMRVNIPIPFARKFIGKRITLQTGPFIDYIYNGTQYYGNVYSSGQMFPIVVNQFHPGLIFAYL